MNLALTDEELAFRDEMRTFFTTQIPAEIRERYARGEEVGKEGFIESQRILNANGLATPHWPVEWGGRDWTPVQKHIWLDELQLASVPEPLAFNTSMVGPVIAAFGSQEQKEKFLPPTANLDIWWCQGFSEPEAGSDLASLKTRAVRDGDDYVVNGQKIWTTNAMHGDKIFTIVRTEPGSERHKGLSMMLIDMDQPGVEARPLKQMSGASEFGEVFFTDARVPAKDCLGEFGAGWRTAMLLLSFERGASGISQYTEFRRQYDAIVGLARALGRHTDPVLRDRLARVLTDLECLRLHSMHVLTQVEQGRDLGFEASMTKLIWSETFQDLWEVYEDLLGEAATLDEVSTDSGAVDLRPLHAQALWSRSVTIWGGSSQVQRNVTAERVLGLPR